MLFALYCKDKADHLQVRKDTRDSHLAYLKGFADSMVFGGPLLAEDGTTPIGSLLVVDLADREAVEAFAAGDPYAKAGLFAETRITGVKQVFPQ
ncbi:MAG: YciI family protein [Rhodospirillales bacterium]